MNNQTQQQRQLNDCARHRRDLADWEREAVEIMDLQLFNDDPLRPAQCLLLNELWNKTQQQATQ